MVVGSDGNVGIGTTSPTETLAVAGNIALGPANNQYRYMSIGGGNSLGYIYGSYSGLGDGIHLGYNSYYSSAGSFVTRNAFASTRLSLGYNYISLATTNDYSGTGAPQARLTITDVGNVGIGTTAPLSLLAVNGGAAIGSYAGANSAPANSLIVSGKIGVGTTAPSTALEVAGTIRSTSGGIQFPDGTTMTTAGGGTVTNQTSTTNIAFASDTGVTNNSSYNISFSTAGAQRMVISNTGRVAIGNSNPQSALDVTGGVAIGSYAGSSAAPSNGLIVSGNVGIGTTSPVNALSVSGAANFTGNVGIGTTTSASPLAIRGSDTNSTVGQGAAAAFSIGNTDGTVGRTTEIQFMAPNGQVLSGLSSILGGYNSGTGGYWGDLAVFTKAAHSGNFPAEKVRITEAGNVGIGTTAPASKLSVNGGGSFVGSVGIGTTSPSNTLSVSGTANITGNVGIGTTSPTTALAIRTSGTNSTVGQAAAAAFSIGNTDGTVGRTTEIQLAAPSGQVLSGFSSIMGGYNSGTGGYWGDLGIFTKAAHSGTVPTEKIRITGSGSVGIGTTSPSYLLHVNGSVAGVGAYNQLSDERYKKDIDDISDSLEKVLAIHGVTYKWIDEERYGSETQIGVLAQEIEKIVPEVVTTGSDGVKRVRYSDLVPLLIEALKREHTNRDAEGAKKDIEIAQLKAKSEQLKGESEQLKAAFCSKFPEMPFCSR
jgi:hypothetical protein